MTIRGNQGWELQKTLDLARCRGAAALLVSGLCLAAATAALAAEEVAGPVTARLLAVIDGDTVRARAHVWLGIEITVDVRIRGIDAPEVHGKCPSEKVMATMATDRLRQSLASPVLRLSNIGEDKYFGRVVADVANAEGSDIAAVMLASGLVRPYDGGSRGDWCGLAAVGGG
jgi:endonuclease YncB( thermonuclease family)